MPEINLAARIVLAADAAHPAKVRRNLPYLHDGQTALLLDAYLPSDVTSASRRPAVLFVHGGPIPAEMQAPKEWGVFQSYGELAAASGLVGVAFNHRLHSTEQYPRSLADLIAAIDYLRTHHAELCIDPDRIALWVFSGAGPHVAWVLRERPSHIKCLLAFYAILDLRHLLPPGVDDATRQLYAQASPASHVAQRAAGLPMFIARAGLDTEMINRGIDAFVAEAFAANACLDVVNHPEGTHAFDVLNDNARSRAIIRSAIAFLQTSLSPSP
jgi:acetyl esterase/lipase